MEQYIVKYAVMAEIERLKKEDGNPYFPSETADQYYARGVHFTCDRLVNFLDTLEVKEVDLDFENELYKAFGQVRDFTLGMRIAKHFFELGLNSQTKDMQEALRIEYEKGRADVLRCIDPDVMVADFCSQPLSKTRSLASIYRQGITDILRKIINYEENSITSTCSIDDSGVR